MPTTSCRRWRPPDPEDHGRVRPPAPATPHDNGPTLERGSSSCSFPGGLPAPGAGTPRPPAVLGGVGPGRLGSACLRHMLFRRRPAWPGYYYRAIFPKLERTELEGLSSLPGDRRAGTGAGEVPSPQRSRSGASGAGARLWRARVPLAGCTTRRSGYYSRGGVTQPAAALPSEPPTSRPRTTSDGCTTERAGRRVAGNGESSWSAADGRDQRGPSRRPRRAATLRRRAGPSLGGRVAQLHSTSEALPAYCGWRSTSAGSGRTPGTSRC